MATAYANGDLKRVKDVCFGVLKVMRHLMETPGHFNPHEIDCLFNSFSLSTDGSWFWSTAYTISKCGFGSNS